MDRGHVIVVGSGVAGAGAAWHLARQGVRTTIVEAARDGRATFAGAGIIAPAASARPRDAYTDLSFAAAAFYPDLLAHLAADGLATDWYGVPGAVFVAADGEEAQRLAAVQRAIEQARDEGRSHVGEVRRLSGAEARSLLPVLADIPAAIHMTGAARLDGRALRSALLASAAAHGAVTVEGEATPLERDGRLAGVDVGGNVLEADAVILAAGAWSAAFAAACGVDVPVYPQRGQILHVDVPGADAGRWPVLVGFHSHYMVAFAPHRLVAGATREDAPGDDPRVTASGMREVLGEMLRLAPGAADATFREFRVGLRPATRDRLPLLGATGLPGLYVCTGHGANGLTAGAYSGVLVARAALGETVDVALSPFSPARASAHTKT